MTEIDLSARDSAILMAALATLNSHGADMELSALSRRLPAPDPEAFTEFVGRASVPVLNERVRSELADCIKLAKTLVSLIDELPVEGTEEVVDRARTMLAQMGEYT